MKHDIFIIDAINNDGVSAGWEPDFIALFLMLGLIAVAALYAAWRDDE